MTDRPILFSVADKLAVIKREIAMRRRVYPRWVEAGRIAQAEADRQIAVMEDIAADYQRQVNDEMARGRLL